MRCLALSAVRPCRARLFRAAQPLVQHPAIGAFRWVTILGLIDVHGSDPSHQLSGENSEEAVGVRNEATARYESCSGLLRFDPERHVQRKSMPLTSRNRPLLLKQFQWAHHYQADLRLPLSRESGNRTEVWWAAAVGGRRVPSTVETWRAAIAQMFVRKMVHAWDMEDTDVTVGVR